METARYPILLDSAGYASCSPVLCATPPEFAAGGKGRVTVREAMSHRAGVPGFEPPAPLEFVQDWDACVANIAAQDHWFGGESVHCYHGVTFGYVLGEIMRRVDGRKPAQFFREEIAQKAGIDMQIGLGAFDERTRVADVGFLKPPFQAKREDGPSARAMTSWGDGGGPTFPQFHRQRESQRADYPSGNAFANARSIAHLCAIAAMGGTLDGVQYISQALIDEASSPQVEAMDGYLGQIRRGLGFGTHCEAYPAPTPTCFH